MIKVLYFLVKLFKIRVMQIVILAYEKAYPFFFTAYDMLPYLCAGQAGNC